MHNKPLLSDHLLSCVCAGVFAHVYKSMSVFLCIVHVWMSVCVYLPLMYIQNKMLPLLFTPTAQPEGNFHHYLCVGAGIYCGSLLP